ncbi:uncharacterized protein LOC114410723 [Glycine soja]|uniref:uncharacterized protein LOC114410723 n=1 Tax=Glycine soja TaxID=3848 RepID=UPI00103E96EC|nr:uncharacterized protein LOC114410723 [Glycine soja]
MNGAVEAANKNIKKIILKMTVSYKDWHEMLSFTIHGYRTSVRTSTGATPFSLVYGMEDVLPFEAEVPSLRILAESRLKESKWAQARFNQLNLIKGKRLAAMSHKRLYQKRVKNAFDKKEMAPKKLSTKRSRRDATGEGSSAALEFDCHRFWSAEHQQRFEAI